MSTVYVECWKCDECGHRWIKTGTWPERCASSKCRKRSWNQDAAARIDARGQETAERSVKSLAEAKEPQAAPKPDMQTLRDICAGKVRNELSLQDVVEIVPNLDQRGVVTEVPICGKTWWEDGEQYRCLMDKGHCEGIIGKHGLRGMSVVVD